MKRLTPTPNQIKEIFKHTYLWFEKYKDSSSDQDFIDMVREGKEIRDRYNFEFTEDLIIGLEEVIEDYYKERTRGNYAR